MESLDMQIGNLFKFPLKLRNEAIDSLFYDVGALNLDEQASLSPLIDLKGTIIVVPPRAAKERGIRHYPNALRFMLKEGGGIQAIVVAGVGSSVLGTAALARDVADHYGFDVAGIVTGYGLADVVVEALGGWFFYGHIDRFRYRVEQMLKQLLTPLPEARPPQADAEDGKALQIPTEGSLVLGNSDVGTLHDILLAGPNKLRLLVGHSKGNLLLSFVLNAMKDELGGMSDALGGQSHPLLNGNLTVVTFGTVVDVPAGTLKLHTSQFLGELDWLGQINSVRSSPLGEIAPHTKIRRAGHHLNPRIPYHLSVSEALRSVPLPASLAAEAGTCPKLHAWGDWARAARN